MKKVNEINEKLITVLEEKIQLLEDQKVINEKIIGIQKEQLILSGVGSSLPNLAECNQASLDYATKKDNPNFFLIKQTFKEGINWALNYMTKNK